MDTFIGRKEQLDRLVGLDGSLVLSAAPWRKTVKGDSGGGCQIDLLYRTKRSVCVVEIKRRREIGAGIVDEVARKGAYLRSRFEGAPGIRSVSGMGLMLGLETERPASEVVSDCMARGVLCLTAKQKVRLLPALNIPDDLLAKAADIILSCV